jgi:hypothetical protein
MEIKGNGCSSGYPLHPGFVNSACFVVKFPGCQLAPDALKISRQFHAKNRQSDQQKIHECGNSLGAKGIRQEQKNMRFNQTLTPPECRLLRQRSTRC